MSNESENKKARRAEDKRADGAVDWTDAPRFTALGIAETWSVTVEAEGQRVLCISHEHVAGLDGEHLEQFVPTICSCAQHLLAFVGAGPIASTAGAAKGGNTIAPGTAPAAATVLTNERIIQIADETQTAESRDGDYILPISFARAIEREVLAHAGNAVAAELSEADIPADAPRAFAKRYSALLEENRKLKADLAHAGAPEIALIAEACAVFDLMLEGCSLQCFGDYENGRGETICPRMDALHDKLRKFGAHAGVTAEPAEAQATLDKICDMFSIGALARTPSTILANVSNALRRENCLSAIERAFFMVPAEPDEDYPDEDPGQECLLNWGDDPKQYAERFRDALTTIAAPTIPAQVPAAEVRAAYEKAAQVVDKLAEQTDLTYKAGILKTAARAIRSLAQQSTADKASEVRAADLEREIAQLKERLEKKHKSHFITSQALHNVIVGNQSAWIEWQHGEGAEAAMTWIHNGLAGPGLIPDGKEAQPWFDANQDDRYEIPPMKEPAAAPSTSDSANTGALGEKGADRG